MNAGIIKRPPVEERKKEKKTLCNQTSCDKLSGPAVEGISKLFGFQAGFSFLMLHTPRSNVNNHNAYHG